MSNTYLGNLRQLEAYRVKENVFTQKQEQNNV